MDTIQRAAELIAEADVLVFAAGAGMGVDSGLPDFRGNTGFWKAYPPYRELGLDFVSLAQPDWFRDDPKLAWGFYGHRLGLYRRTAPHEGFAILRRWAERKEHGAFVFTSNVDGHFGKAGFPEERISEIHGSLLHAQCIADCGVGIFEADFDVEVDEKSFRAKAPLPTCLSCGALARPNVLLFGDGEWDPSRSDAQRRRLERWLGEVVGSDSRLVVVECGAGTAVPSVRNFSEFLVRSAGARLIRINPREPEVPKRQIGLPSGALDALRRLDALIGMLPPRNEV